MRAPPVVVLDANVWGRVVNPRAVGPFRQWYDRLVGSGRSVVLPEIADYEVRRSLPLLGIGARRWGEYEEAVDSILYAPLSTPVMRGAAEVWALSRREGRPFTSEERLDGDAILRAQTLALGPSDQVAVATANVRHIGRYVTAVPWEGLEV